MKIVAFKRNEFGFGFSIFLWVFLSVPVDVVCRHRLKHAHTYATLGHLHEHHECAVIELNGVSVQCARSNATAMTNNDDDDQHMRSF